MNGAVEQHEQTGSSSVIPWGIYCASSWTWCIGMYLPIIMLRLFGWPGFLVFAIPNLVGLVGFGYLCSAERSRWILREHRHAVRLFSCATVAFQLFFLAWAWSTLFETGASTGATIAVCAWLLAMALAIIPDRAWLVLGVVSWLVSIGLFCWFLAERGTATLEQMQPSGELDAGALALLAPAIVFGFLLCPWLDGTFHRARIRSRSPHAFLVFGICFAPMIIFTCAYAAGGMIVATGIVLAQLTVQATFTAAVHVREAWLGGLDATKDRARPWPWAAILPAIAILVGTMPVLAGESSYLRFLGLYGLVFPAYVLLFIARRDATRPTSTMSLLFMLLILPCALLYDWAFIGRATGHALLALGCLLLAWLVLVTLGAGRRTA